jgi:hypothetical protein
MKEYSDKEMKLFSYFGFGCLADRGDDSCITAPVIYRMCVEKAFLNNMQGEAVESLRRCFSALVGSKVFRMTPEWDEMIDL